MFPKQKQSIEDVKEKDYSVFDSPERLYQNLLIEKTEENRKLRLLVRELAKKNDTLLAEIQNSAYDDCSNTDT